MLSDILQSAHQTTHTVVNGWVVKLIASGVLVLMTRHFAIFTLFAFVVFVDLFAKFLALSHGMELSDGKKDTSLVTALYDIPEAHRRGIINSYAMKTQFVGKLIIYMFLVVPSGSIDVLIKLSSGRSEFCILVISYLCATELLSIVENLNDAGVPALSGLLDIIKRKRGN